MGANGEGRLRVRRPVGRTLSHPGWLGLLTVSAVACIRVPAGVGLGDPRPSPASLDRRAWLAKVEVADPEAVHAQQLTDALTLNLAEFVRKSGHFRAVDLLPGQVGPDDVVLRLAFARYRQRRAPHPAYFPAAFLTATLYIWVGGPIFTDTSDLEATLSIEPAEPEYSMPSGLNARTRLVQELLDDSVNSLRTSGGAP
jgi:hypothetical protein